MQDIQNQILTGRVELDGCRFQGCTFNNAQMVFAGGPAPILINCKLEDAQLAFEGAAHNTILHLRNMAGGSAEFRAALIGMMPELGAPAPQPAND